MLPAVITLLAALSGAVRAEPAVMGFNFPSWWDGAYTSASAGRSLDGLAATGAGWVAVIPTWYQADKRGSEMRATKQTESDASLGAVIRSAKGKGLHVVLKPHLDLDEGGPRALIRAKDPKAWFANYRGFILRYARLAAQERVELFVIGTELFGMSGNYHYREWARVIREVRAIYPGKITYAANWYDAGFVPFWRKLDFIGVDGYYPVPGRTRAAFRLGWRLHAALLQGLSATTGKPVLFTEVGLASQKGANLKPAVWWEFGELDLKVQADYLGAFLDVFYPKPWFAGMLYWAWELDPNAGGSHDKSMAVQGKPALQTLETFFRRANPRPRPRALSPESVRRLPEITRKFFGAW